jgi:pSer/pThr/pTyr-binding forkhead associated (FHA) protein
MDILRNLRRLESRLAKKVNETAQKMAPSNSREPLEIVHLIVETVEKHIEPAGRGRYVFPFNQISICIAADSSLTRARFEAVFESEPSVQQRIFKTLESAGCASTGLIINTIYVAQPEPHWTAPDFNLEFDRIQQPGPSPRSLKLTVVYGAAEQQTYVFTSSRVNLGRRLDVRDNQNRLMRTNHVAFTECAEEPNPGVSRRHAHIEAAGSPAEYRLYDDRSAHGTTIQRSGVTILVPPGPRGIRLQSGDEIGLGEARLRVEIECVDNTETQRHKDTEKTGV